MYHRNLLTVATTYSLLLLLLLKHDTRHRMVPQHTQHLPRTSRLSPKSQSFICKFLVLLASLTEDDEEGPELASRDRAPTGATKHGADPDVATALVATKARATTFMFGARGAYEEPSYRVGSVLCGGFVSRSNRGIVWAEDDSTESATRCIRCSQNIARSCSDTRCICIKKVLEANQDTEEAKSGRSPAYRRLNAALAAPCRMTRRSSKAIARSDRTHYHFPPRVVL